MRHLPTNERSDVSDARKVLDLCEVSISLLAVLSLIIPISMFYLGEPATSIQVIFVIMVITVILTTMAHAALQGNYYKLHHQSMIKHIETQISEGNTRELPELVVILKDFVRMEVEGTKGVFKKATLVANLQAAYKKKVIEWIKRMGSILSDSKSRIDGALRSRSLLEASAELERYKSWIDCLESLDAKVVGYREGEGAMRRAISEQKVEIEAELKAELEVVKKLDAQNHDVEASKRLREIVAKARACGFDDLVQSTADMGQRIRAEGRKELQEELLSKKRQLVDKMKAGDFAAVSSDLNRIADIATREELPDIASGAKDLLSQLDIVERILRVLKDRQAATVDDLSSETGKSRADILTILIDFSASLGIIIENGLVKVNPINMTKLVEFIDNQFDAWSRAERTKDSKKI